MSYIKRLQMRKLYFSQKETGARSVAMARTRLGVILNFNYRKWCIQISNKILFDGDLSKPGPEIKFDFL